MGPLWLQEQQLSKVVELKNVPCLENPTDLRTKHVSVERITTYSGRIGYTHVSGRTSSTAGLRWVGRAAGVGDEGRTSLVPGIDVDGPGVSPLWLHRNLPRPRDGVAACGEMGMFRRVQTGVIGNRRIII